MLALKAEVVLALLVSLRHRSVRLVLGFAAAILGFAAVSGGGGPQADASVLLIGGAITVVAASRALARGPMLESSRRAAAAWWQPSLGRLAGVLLVTLPAVIVALVVLQSGVLWAGRMLIVTLTYAAALGAVTLAVTPLTGASAGAALGFVAALAGAMPPSGIAVALERWPALATAGVTVWNALPLEWRARRWLHTGGLGDPLLLVAWIVVGVLGAAWAVARAYRAPMLPREA